jgi:uncharacterized protein HemY
MVLFYLGVRRKVVGYLTANQANTITDSPQTITKWPVVIIVTFFAVAFAFVFFLVWLLSKEDIGSYQPTRRV